MVGMVDNIGGYRRHWFECFYWLQWMNLNAHQDRQRDRRGRCAGLWGTPSPCSPAAPRTPCLTLAWHPSKTQGTPTPCSFTAWPSLSPLFHQNVQINVTGMRSWTWERGQCRHSSNGYVMVEEQKTILKLKTQVNSTSCELVGPFFCKILHSTPGPL